MQQQTVIILVGMIASGKTSWAKEHYGNFTRLDGDSLKTSTKMVKALKAALDRGENVIADATNVTIERRKDIINECKRRGVKVYGVVFKVPMTICMQRAKKREADQISRGEAANHIPDIAFYTANKKYVEPTMEEGFEFIGYVDNSINEKGSGPLSSGRRK